MRIWCVCDGGSALVSGGGELKIRVALDLLMVFAEPKGDRKASLQENCGSYLQLEKGNIAPRIWVSKSWVKILLKHHGIRLDFQPKIMHQSGEI